MTNLDARTTAALRDLDPAGATTPAHATLTPPEVRRAADTLAHILATDPGGGPRPEPAPTRLRQRRSRGRVLVALGALVAAAVVVPFLTTVGDEAYASWSPTPVALSPVEGAAAADACLGSLGQTAEPGVAPLLAERRGGWTYVLVQPTARSESSCIMPTAEITGGSSRDRRRWYSNTGEQVSEPAPDPDELRVLVATVASTREGLFSYSEGQVGRDVADVAFTTPRGVHVQASVAGGRYAVWWPAGKNDLRSPEISGAPDIDITLADGTTYRRPR